MCVKGPALDIHTGTTILPAHLVEHSYAKQPSEPIRVPPRPKAVVSKKSTQLSTAGDIDIIHIYDSLLHPLATTVKDKEKPRPPTKKTNKRMAGSTVNVIYEGKPVAKAVVMDGTLLHGKQIPSGYVKLSIKEMLDRDLEVPLQFKGPFDDDDDILMSGLVTAWKLDTLSS